MRPKAVKPTPKAVEVSPTGGCERFRPLVARYDWDENIALAVMQAESGCNPYADNTGLNSDGTTDKGLMQINSIHVTSGLIGDQERFIPESNIRAAYAIYQGNSWNAWSSYNSGKHIKFL